MTTRKNEQKKAQKSSGKQTVPEQKSKLKNLPTPPSANGKAARQSLPRVTVSWEHNIEGMPYVADERHAGELIRSYFIPEVWVQQHVFAMFTNSFSKLMCIRRISIGDTDSALVDTKLIFLIANEIKAANITLALTRPTGVADNLHRTSIFINRFDVLSELLGLRLEAFLIMTKTGQINAAREMATERIMRGEI